MGAKVSYFDHEKLDVYQAAMELVILIYAEDCVWCKKRNISKGVNC